MAKTARAIKAAVHPRYEMPPVVEALCEIYFVGSQWDTTTPGVFYERVHAEYPEKAQADHAAFALQIEPGRVSGGTVPLDPRTRFARRDNSRMIQISRDLLVVNQLRPYPHYQAWRPVVLKMLDVYRKLTRPAGIKQLGVRYINRIVIPSPGSRIDEYFRIYPALPKELGDAQGAFALQMSIVPQGARNHQLTMTLASAPAEPGQTAFLLDLYDVTVLGGQPAFTQVRRLLDEAHGNIVHTFENAITDPTRQLFKGAANG
jgi:uncharacterized protein (TIGR04255 family)